jgi:hypothetical protein
MRSPSSTDNHNAGRNLIKVHADVFHRDRYLYDITFIPPEINIFLASFYIASENL